MPRHVVADDLGSGRLVHLAMPEGAIVYPIHAQWRRDSPAGPARTWLLERLMAKDCARCGRRAGHHPLTDR
jgi:DNA-binding transcriptional LysR family regulator